MEPIPLVWISVEGAADVTRWCAILTIYNHLFIVIVIVVSNSLSKPVFPAVSIRATTNFIASSFFWIHGSRLAPVSVVMHTLDITEGKEQFIPIDIKDICGSPSIGITLKVVLLNVA
jgi:hypothetical protein